jgi:AcrR family transcriptional regulator
MTKQLKSRGRGKSGKKRSQILEAATHLFLEQGITSTSMEQIAETASVSKQTLYSHFGGKEELFVAAIEQRCMQHDLSESLFSDERSLPEVLLDLARHLNQLLLSEEAIKVHRLCISGVDQYPGICELFYDAGPANVISLFTDYLQRQLEAGHAQIANIDFAAQQFLHMVKGEAHMRAMLNLQQDVSAKEIDSYLQSCVEVFLAAYAKR